MKRLAAYQTLSKYHAESRSRNPIPPAAAALICLAVVTILWLVPVRSTPFSITVQTTGLDVTIKGEAAVIDYLQGEQILVTGAQSLSVPAVGINATSSTNPHFLVARGTKAALKNLTVAGETTVAIFAAEDELQLLFRKGSRVSGEIDLIGRLTLSSTRTGGKEVSLGKAPDAPEEILFMTRGAGGNSEAGQRSNRLLTDIQILRPKLPLVLKGLRPQAVSFFQEKPHMNPDAPPDFESTVTGGHLKLRHTGADLPLHWGDELYIQDLSVTYGEVTVEEGIQLRLEGVARHIRSGPPGYLRNRKPTLLAYLFHNHQLGFFWSALTFVWTLLWAVKRTVFV
jgi:hypothetical protein